MIEILARPTIALNAPELGLRLQATDGGGIEWAVAKPVDLGRTHGVKLTAERLVEMATAYDPAVEAAAINIDHECKGPAHGWVERFFVRAGMLWAVPIELSDELAEGIKKGRYRRQSLEITLDHPETHTWYPAGLAILGANSPAIKALPPIRLAERRRYAFGNGTAAAAPPATSKTHVEQPAPPERIDRAHGISDESSLRGTPPRSLANRMDPAPATANAALDADRRSSTQRTLDRAHGVSDERFAELAARYPTSLARESNDPGEDPAPAIANAALDADRRSSTQRAFDRAHGVSDERAIALQAKYSGAFPSATALAAETADDHATALSHVDAAAALVARSLSLSAIKTADDISKLHLQLARTRLEIAKLKRQQLDAASAPLSAAAGRAKDSGDLRTFEVRQSDLRHRISDERYLVLLERFPESMRASMGAGRPWWSDPRSRYQLTKEGERSPAVRK